MTSTPTSEWSGYITLPDGREFVWMQAADDKEVYGHLETPTGQIIKGSGGWWRTTDPEKAAGFATLAFPS